MSVGNDLAHRVAAALPALRPAVERFLAGEQASARAIAYAGTPPGSFHGLCREVLLPYVRAQLAGGDEATLARIFALLEELAGDPAARNAIDVSLVEGLDKEAFAAARLRMGPALRRLVRGAAAVCLPGRAPAGQARVGPMGRPLPGLTPYRTNAAPRARLSP